MRNGIVSICGWLNLLFIAIAMAGCDESEKPAQNAPADRADVAALRQGSQRTNKWEVLRVREDALRKRLWVLALDEVWVYDTARMRKRLIKKIVLPRWSVIGFRYVCMPDMVLDEAGSAYISSNGQARLLRIDAGSFELADYAISFQESAGRDSGFGALAFAPDGTLFARTTPGGLLWKIDIAKANAIMTEVNQKLSMDECAIATPLLNDFARSQLR